MPQKYLHDVVEEIAGPFKDGPFYQHARVAAVTSVIRCMRDFVLGEVEKNKDIAIPVGMNPVPGKEVVNAMFGPFLSMKKLDRTSLFIAHQELMGTGINVPAVLLAGKIVEDALWSLQLMAWNVLKADETTPTPTGVLEIIDNGAKASIPGFSFPTIPALVAGFADHEKKMQKRRESEQHEVCSKCGDVHYLDHGRAVVCHCGGHYKLAAPKRVVING